MSETDTTPRALRAMACADISEGDIRHGSVLLHVANVIETKDMIIGLLRAQLRVLGHIPMVSESAEIAQAEIKMRAAGMGH